MEDNAHIELARRYIKAAAEHLHTALEDAECSENPLDRSFHIARTQLETAQLWIGPPMQPDDRVSIVDCDHDRIVCVTANPPVTIMIQRCLDCGAVRARSRAPDRAGPWAHPKTIKPGTLHTQPHSDRDRTDMAVGGLVRELFNYLTEE